MKEPAKIIILSQQETCDCDKRKGNLYLGNEAEKFVQELNNSKSMH